MYHSLLLKFLAFSFFNFYHRDGCNVDEITYGTNLEDAGWPGGHFAVVEVSFVAG